ncbi:hypothetical protein LCGC14_2912500, partial [marine sediment metagenome]
NIKAYMGLGGGAKNPKEAVGAIYSDNSGADQLLAYTSATTISGDAWYTFTFSSAENLQAGDYWLVIHTGTKVDIFGESTGGSSEYNGDTYSDGPTQTFGSSTSESWQYSIYASYDWSASDSNDIDVEIEWSVTDTVNTMDYLRWDFSTSGSPTTEFYVWKDTFYELQVGSSPLNLTTDYYDEATNTIKVKFAINDSSSPFILYLDQLRLDYTVSIATVSNNTLDFYALFDENSGSSTFDNIQNFEGLLQGDTNWTVGLNNSALLFDGTGNPFNPGVNETRNDLPLQSEFSTSNGTFTNYGDLEFNDDTNNTILTSEFSQGASGQGTFGYNSIGSSSKGHGKNIKFGSKFTLTEDGSVNNIKAYMGLGGGAKNPKEAVGAIYSD